MNIHPTAPVSYTGFMYSPVRATTISIPSFSRRRRMMTTKHEPTTSWNDEWRLDDDASADGIDDIDAS